MSAYRAGWFLIPAPIIGCSVLGIATSTALRNHVAISEVPDAYSRTATEGDLFLGDAYLAVVHEQMGLHGISEKQEIT
jgi:hypothetical protein